MSEWPSWSLRRRRACSGSVLCCAAQSQLESAHERERGEGEETHCDESDPVDLERVARRAVLSRRRRAGRRVDALQADELALRTPADAEAAPEGEAGVDEVALAACGGRVGERRARVGAVRAERGRVGGRDGRRGCGDGGRRCGCGRVCVAGAVGVAVEGGGLEDEVGVVVVVVGVLVEERGLHDGGALWLEGRGATEAELGLVGRGPCEAVLLLLSSAGGRRRGRGGRGRGRVERQVGVVARAGAGGCRAACRRARV